MSKSQSKRVAVQKQGNNRNLKLFDMPSRGKTKMPKKSGRGK